MSGKQYHVVDDEPKVLKEIEEQMGAIDYDRHYLILKPEDLTALQSGKVILTGVGSMGTTEYMLVIRLQL